MKKYKNMSLLLILLDIIYFHAEVNAGNVGPNEVISEKQPLDPVKGVGI